MKGLGVAFLTLFSLYLLLFFKIIPYRFVSIATLDAMQAQIDKASASPAPPATSPAPAIVAPQTVKPVAAATVAATAATTPVQATQLISDYNGALLLVEGQKGVGSGFLCNMNGHTYAVTNAHVLSDNVGVKLTGLNGTTFTAGASAVAVGHDIVKMEVPSAPKAFEVMSNLDNNLKVGDRVIVLGNQEGGGVVRPTEGSVVGIGPDLVEVDAPFVKGNSGSPIIHAATGKVIGIATYIMERKVTPGENGGVTLGPRRFGYRLDTVQTWEPINWQTFFAQAAQVEQIEKLSQDFIKMFDNLDKTHHFDPESYSNPELRHTINTFLQDADHKGISQNDKNNLIRGLFADLRTESRSDIAAFNARPSYDYFHRDVQDESRFRDQLYDSFTRSMANFEQ